METIITLQGTENQLYNLQNAIEITDNEMPKEVETRVYVVDSEEHNTKHLTDDEFQTLAEGLGRVYTLQGFQEAFNYGDVNTFTDIIRIINVII